MRARGDIGAAKGSFAEAGEHQDGTPKITETEACLADGDVSERALRMLQLQDDARLEFERAEESLKTVWYTVDRVRAGELDAVDPMPVGGAVDVAVPVPGIAVMPAASGRSRYLAAGFVIAGLIAGWISMSVIDATRDPDAAASRGAIVSEAVAAVSPMREEATALPVTGGQADFGRTVYAERFAKAPASERMCLARAIYYEARGEEMAGQIAVAQVVLNRARSKKWPDTICGVINQGVARGEKCQFSYACFTHLTPPNGPMWEQAQQVADQALSGQAWLRELVEATYYHTVTVAPVWRTNLTAIATIGTHVFYRDGNGLRENASDPQAYQAAAAAQAVRTKVAAIRGGRPKVAAVEASGEKKSPGKRGDDWKANVFAP